MLENLKILLQLSLVLFATAAGYGQFLTEKVSESRLKNFKHSSTFNVGNESGIEKEIELFDFEKFFGLVRTTEDKFSMETNQMVKQTKEFGKIANEKEASEVSITATTQKEFIIRLLGKNQANANRMNVEDKENSTSVLIEVERNKFIKSVNLTDDINVQIGKPIKIWSNYKTFLDEHLLRYSLNLLAINMK